MFSFSTDNRNLLIDELQPNFGRSIDPITCPVSVFPTLPSPVAHILALQVRRAKQPSQVACCRKRSEVLRSLRLLLRAQSQGRHTIDRLKTRGSTRQSCLKRRERTIVGQTSTGTVSRATLGKRMRDEVDCVWVFPSA